MDSAKLKKLQDYSVVLTQQAESKEAQGNTADAAKDYVKLVDVLLLLANEAKDHPTWQQLISQAEHYQEKARSMVEPDSVKQTSVRKSSNPYEMKQYANPSTGQSQERPISDSSSSFNPFRRLSLMGKKPESRNENDGKAPEGVHQATVLSSANNLNPRPATREQQFTPPINRNQSTSNPEPANNQQMMKQEERTVPYSLYSQVLEERSALKREVDLLRSKEKEYLETIESKEKQFAETVSSMVPKADYDDIQARLADSVPRSDYEQALAISAIPKQRYIELQAQVTELESRLQNSIPRVIIDELAEYISFLISTASAGDGKIMARPALEGEEESKGDAR